MLKLRQKQYDYPINLRKFHGNSLRMFKTDTTTTSLLCVVTCHAYPGNHICWPTTLKRDAMHFTFNACIWDEGSIYIDRNELALFSSIQHAFAAQTIEMSLFVIRIVVKPTRSPIAISRIDGISVKNEKFLWPK